MVVEETILFYYTTTKAKASRFWSPDPSGFGVAGGSLDRFAQVNTISI